MSPREINAVIAQKTKELEEAEGTTCSVFSRCVGYHSPTADWNIGKKEEFTMRNTFNVMR